MKTSLNILMLFIFFVSCGDMLDRDNAMNIRLDSEIANRMAQLVNVKENGTYNPEQVDREVKAMSVRISSYDASTEVIKRADEYFNKLADEHLVKRKPLFKLILSHQNLKLLWH